MAKGEKMGRLIDADRFKAYMLEKYLLYDNTLADIDAQPTVDAEPVRHGRWEIEYETEDGREIRCSECRMVFWAGKGRDGNYCPNCGAKMDEVEE
jgi:hypothetical protein